MSKGAATTFCPKGDCSPMYNGLFTFFSLRFRAGAYLESFCINGQFQLLGNHFSASFDASEFCWQIGLNFLQYLRPYLIQSIFLQLIFLMQSHGVLQLIFQFHVFSQIILDAVSRAWECPCREESFLPPVTTPQSTC